MILLRASAAASPPAERPAAITLIRIGVGCCAIGRQPETGVLMIQTWQETFPVIHSRTGR